MALEKTFDAKSAEKRIYEKWEKENCFRAGANASREATFSIMIPNQNKNENKPKGKTENPPKKKI